MYTPPAFAETDLDVLHEFMMQNSFAILVSQSASEPAATHLPVLLDRNCGDRGTLIGHMAKANQQWQQAAGQCVLTIFSGPHAYISPTAYRSENVVPTWNYVAVHAYGRLEVVDDVPAKLAILQQYVEFYERTRTNPWRLDVNDDFINKLADLVVGFRIPIDRIEGKWKLGQNHSVARRQNVIDDLEQQPGENAAAIARLMAGTLDGSSTPT